MLNLEIPEPSIEIGGTPPFRPEPGRLYPVDPPRRPFLGRLKAALTCALLAATTGLVVQATLLLHAATQATRGAAVAIPAELRATRADVNAQIAAARRDLARQLAQTRRDVLDRADRQVSNLRRDTFREVAATRADVMGEVGQLRAAADRRVGDSLARVDVALGKVDELRGDLRPVLLNAAALEQHADALTGDAKDSLDDLYFDLKGSVESATVAATSLSQMSLDFRTALPGAITTWQGIGHSVDGITANINRLTKPRWYDRLLGYGLNGVVIYRSLNPATSVPVAAAQIISSRQ